MCYAEHILISILYISFVDVKQICLFDVFVGVGGPAEWYDFLHTVGLDQMFWDQNNDTYRLQNNTLRDFY